MDAGVVVAEDDVADDGRPVAAVTDVDAVLPDAVAGKPGEYLLEASGKDSKGHDVLTSVTFGVAGPGETVWNYRNPYAIDLVTDKESYEPGQTAMIMVKTPIAGDALVTVDPHFLVTDVNEQTVRITGYSREELIGSPFPDYFTDPERATVGVKQTLAEGFVTKSEVGMIHIS